MSTGALNAIGLVFLRPSLMNLLILMVLTCANAFSLGHLEKRPRPSHSRAEWDRSVHVRISFDTFNVPRTWWRIDFKDRGDRSFEAKEVGEMIQSVVTLQQDTLVSPAAFAGIGCGTPKMLEFLQKFRPKIIERLFAPATYDTVVTDRRGNRVVLRDMAVYYNIFSHDTSLQEVIDFLKGIDGVKGVQRQSKSKPLSDRSRLSPSSPQTNDPYDTHFGSQWHLGLLINIQPNSGKRGT
jgi:hypothetical protein